MSTQTASPAAWQQLAADPSRWVPLVLAFFGIPAALLAAILGDLQIPRSIYGEATFLLWLELLSIAVLFALIFFLRWQLAKPWAPRGILRHVLDYLALSHWHPAVWIALIGVLVLPEWWYLRNQWWTLALWLPRGQEGLRTSDLQAVLDGIAVVMQHSLIAGLPLLFVFHLLARWKPRILPWVLLPIYFVGVAIGIVISVMIVHMGD